MVPGNGEVLAFALVLRAGVLFANALQLFVQVVPKGEKGAFRVRARVLLRLVGAVPVVVRAGVETAVTALRLVRVEDGVVLVGSIKSARL